MTTSAAHSEVLIDAPDGGVEHLWVWTPDFGDDAGTRRGTVLLLPAGLGDPTRYAPLLAGLATRGFAAVALQPRVCRTGPGPAAHHGLAPVRQPATLCDLVGSAEVAVRWAREHLGTPVTVLGTGLGALQAVALAARSDAVAATVVHNLVDPLQVEDPITGWPDWLRRHRRSLRPGLRLAARVAPDACLPGEGGYPLGLLASIWDADLTGACDGSIDCPVLVLAATADAQLPLAQARAMYDRIAAPHKEFVPCEAAGHELLADQPELVLSVLSDRLGALVAAGVA